jgi:hypothetical protein
MISSCAVDGDDADDVILSMVNSSRFREQVRAIMIDGVALGGFNVVNIKTLSEALNAPVITVSRDQPDIGAIEKALKAHFPDWERRLSVIVQYDVREVKLPEGHAFISSVGIEDREADALVRRCTVRGCLPEPVRLAHHVATALVRGESKGKA